MSRIIDKSIWLMFLFSIMLIIPPVLAENGRKEIVIGTHLPLSGDASSAGAEQKWAYEKAVEDVNKAGGIYVKEYGKKLPVRLTIMDDETNPQKASDAVEHLVIREKADLLLSGQIGARGVISGMIAAEKHKTYYHGTVIWVPDFLEHNFQWSTMYFFDMVQGGAIPFEIWNSLPGDQHPQKPALFIEDTFDGKQIGDLWVTLAEKYGYKIILWETMATGSNDFSKQISEAKSKEVDAIIVFANTEESIAFVRQMKEMDFSVKFFQGYKGTWATEFYEALGKDADYIFCDGFWSEDYPFPGAKELGERFYKDFGKHSVSAGMYYALCQILWQAIEKAGTLDSAKVRQAVLNNQFYTVMGRVDYDDRGVAVFPLAQFQWWESRQQIVYPWDYSNFKFKIAPSWRER